ncbi:7-carboxy-7-deazaguanine synthase [Lacunisphaera limnophila]|uniref:7-carboxy-7-deazaguanine synthase n=1 Tax=Lacunisphaera limnophila TaxID=1838286 RepID=A0A1D8AYX1_9BACT|nr:7-carboxy-7-deazaguanine synthase QueE [Lacunisphaera limnophila]AOS46102.1 7-carboxy-7-deazaguanine synthase [Lacunisphaera limnophila]
MSTLPIYETFYAWQGEGCHMGRAAFFIRTFGCPVKCPWCDSAGTWHPDWVPEKIERFSADELADRAVAHRAEFAVITGGEPTIHDLTELTAALHRRDLPTHLETSGSFPIKGDFDWITVSPKWAKLPLPENLRRANEIKLIIEDGESVEKWRAQVSPLTAGQVVWLHPEWSKREDPAVMNSISVTVKTQGHPFRAGYQLHRVYNVDSLDSGARPIIPLGGNLEIGY